MKEVDPLERLCRLEKLAGSRKKLAEELEIHAGYLSDIMHGRREVPKSLLKTLGLRRVVVEGVRDVG